MKILILNTPCYGFGDILFAKKLADYLRRDYKAKVDIASTQYPKFKTLGEKALSLKTRTGKHRECRMFKSLVFESNKTYDFIFVAPLAQDNEKNIEDVKRVVPYATLKNTYWFSEYGDDPDKDIDFFTGVGENYFGIFIETHLARIAKYDPSIPYFFTYIATSDNIERWDRCIESFVKMVAHKYKKYSKVKCMGSMGTMHHLFKLSNYKLKKVFGKHWGTLQFKHKNKTQTKVFNKKNPGVFILAPYKLPMTHKQMIKLMRNSLPDILITGDQSLSDVLSCCPGKNIWYQTAEWKEDFAEDLARNLPQPYLKSPKTSCGTMKALRYKSDYANFVNTQNFFKNSKTKLNKILRSRKKRSVGD